MAKSSKAPKARQLQTKAYEPYAGEDLARLRIQVTTMGDLLLSAADRYPDTPALVFPETALTYAQLAERAMHRARCLMALGVRPRDHVGILMHTCADFVELFFAIAFCGGVVVPINARYKAAELAYVIENGDLVTVITTDAVADQVNFIERMTQALPGLAGSADRRQLSMPTAPKLRNLVVMGKATPPGFVTAAEFDAGAASVDELEVHRARMRVRVRDVGMMLYTSGTTANPKGCLITHEAQVRNSIALGRHRYRLTHEDKLWSPLPMFHIASVLPMLAIFDVGGTYLTMGHFDAGVALRMLREYEVTATYPSFVTIMQGLIYHPDFPTPISRRIRLMNSNFAVQPPGVAEPIMKAMPNAVQVGSFGMTEAAGTVCTGSPEEPESQRITRLGKPLPGLEVRILDPETQRDAAVGGRGEVLVRGYSLLEGYYKDAEKTAQSLDAEGWYHTGDIGSLDEHGTIMFHGRFKDMLKVGGENVAAAEIEALLRAASGGEARAGRGHSRSEIRGGAGGVRRAQARRDRRRTASSSSSAAQPSRASRCRAWCVSCREWPMSTSKIQKFRLREQLLRELGLQ